MWQGVQRRAVSYVRSTKGVLARYRLVGGRSGSEGYSGSPQAQMPLGGPETGLAGHPETGGGTIMIERLGQNCAFGTDGRSWIVLLGCAWVAAAQLGEGICGDPQHAFPWQGQMKPEQATRSIS